MRRRIVICGSMSFFEQMMKIQDILTKSKIDVILPDDDNKAAFKLSSKQFEEYKRRVSYQYLTKIRDPKTWSILVINPEKHNINNYIGPNTFAEIAVAFAQKKKLYLLYDIPQIYSDELNAWKAITLKGSILRIINDFKSVCFKETRQMSLVTEYSE